VGEGTCRPASRLIGFKSYDQGREKWQGPTLILVWFDEEPPAGHLHRGPHAHQRRDGPRLLTFTPLLGMSDVVKRFLIDKVPGTHVTQMTIDDALHYTAEQRAAIIASYPEARARRAREGHPDDGLRPRLPDRGGVREVRALRDPGALAADRRHRLRLGSPERRVRLAWDRDNDVLYVIAAHRAREQTPLMFAGAVKPGARGCRGRGRMTACSTTRAAASSWPTSTSRRA
jgi:phage terminase large subunit-like protein